MRNLKYRYQIFDSDTFSVVLSTDSLQSAIMSLDKLVEGFKIDWVVDDLEKCGVSDCGRYEVLDMLSDSEDDHYNTVKTFIIQ